jgi:hypothetical protein
MRANRPDEEGIKTEILLILIGFRVGIADLMKKGLRLNCLYNLRRGFDCWNRRPDEEGIKTRA